MNLEEFVREKYQTGSKKTSLFDSKYQMVLKRLHAVFDCFEADMVKVGTRNKIVCEYGAPELDSFNRIDCNPNRACAIKLAAVFAFVIENYYMPNLNFKQRTRQDTDQLFQDFIVGLYLGNEKLDDLASRFQNEVFENRVKLGDHFEQYLKTIKDTISLKREIIAFCKEIYDCKRAAAALFRWLTDSEHSEDEKREKIKSVYDEIYYFCEKLCTEENDINLMHLYPFNWSDPSSIENFLPLYFDITKFSCDEKVKLLYEQFQSAIQYYLDVLNIPVYVIDDIDEKEQNMLNYLLDEFGKDSSEENSAALEKHVLHIMETDQWEKIPLAHREKLLSLIKDLIEEDWEDEVDVYERLNKYIRAYTTDGVKRALKRIEFKLTFPPVYRIFLYVEKLYDFYGDMENAKAIMDFLGSEELNAIERKIKKVFDEQEALYQYCQSPDVLNNRFVKMLEESFPKIFDGTESAKDTEKSSE